MPLPFDLLGRGMPLVLLHAFPLDRRMWHPQYAPLADHARILAPDLPGFGEAAFAEGELTVELMARRVAMLLDQVGIFAPVVLAGVSMGGYVALAFARHFPGRVRGLILADTRADADDPAARANRARAIETVQTQGPAAQVEKMREKVLGATTRASRPEVVAEYDRIALSQSAEGLLAGLAALRDRPDSTALLGLIDKPALVLVGEEDEVAPPAVAEAMFEAIPECGYATLPATGHLSNLESPLGFNAHVREFLKTL